MTINPGEFNRKILIEKSVIKTDDCGNQLAEWQPWKSLWAKINSLYGQEYWQAAAHGQENTVVFTMRWCKLLDVFERSKELPLYRIVYNGVQYDIKSYDNVKGENKLVKIKAVSK